MQFIIILLALAVAQYFFPWWSLALVPFGVAFWRRSSAGGAFTAGALAASLLWLGVAFYQHSQSGGILTGQMAETLKMSMPVLFVAIAVVAGLVGGFSAMSGTLVRQLFTPKRAL